MVNMWNLLAGYSGLVSLGQPAFIGLAGYTTGALAAIGLSPYIGVLAGGGVGAAFALIVSIPIFRLKGVYFAVGTLIMVSAVQLWFNQWAPHGIAIKAASEISTTELYYSGLVIGIASIVILRLILRSKFGLGLMAIRDNEITASTSGVNVFRLKLYSFVISAFFTGIAGGVFYLYNVYVDPIGGFSISWTILILTSCIIGGIGTINGPILGVIVTVILQQYLARYVGIELLILGAIIVVTMLVAPRGILGKLQRNPLTGAN